MDISCDLLPMYKANPKLRHPQQSKSSFFYKSILSTYTVARVHYYFEKGFNAAKSQL